MLKLKSIFMLFGLLAALTILIGFSPKVVSASIPLGLTLTPTEEVTSTPESPTDTPESPTPGAPTATSTGVIVPPNATPTPTSQISTPPAPTETPEEEDEPEPTRTPQPVLPETGEGPGSGPFSGFDWLGFLAIVLFALLGTLVFRAFAPSRVRK